MASGPRGAVLRSLDRLFGEGTVAALTESELLTRFARRRDESAFEALATRHGPMVLGVCRRILGDSHAADDAFQAVFLILVKKAGSIRDGERLGPWLHGVARRVALRARAKANRRRDIERPGAEEAAVAAPNIDDGQGFGLDPELRAVLDEEIDRLPEKYRAPVVLCYLEGLTHDQAAHRLGWPVGTVRSRMAWARDKLRVRLTRRGLAAPAALLASAIGSQTVKASVLAIDLAPAVPPALLRQTIQAALHVAAHPSGTLAAGAASASSVELAKGALEVMFMQKLKVGALAIAALVATAGGGMAVVLQEAGQGGGAAPAAGQDRRDDQDVRELKAQMEVLQKQLHDVMAERADLQEKHQALVARLERLQSRNQQMAAERERLLDDLEKLDPDTAREARETVEVRTSRAAVAPVAPAAVTSTAPAQAIPRGTAGAAVGFAPTAGVRARARVAGEAAAPVAAVAPVAPVAAVAPAAPVAALAPAAGVGIGAGGPGGATVASTAPAGGGFGGPTFSGGFGDPGYAATTVQPRIPRLMTRSLIATRPEGSDRYWAYSTETGEWDSLVIPEGVKAIPIASENVLALQFEGDSIAEIAAFDAGTGRWYPQALREPVEGRATPILSGNAAVFGLGRFVYAFSAEAGRWGVLELPEGSKPAVPILHSSVVLVEGDDTLHTFSLKTGRWSSLDTNSSQNSEEP